MFNRSTQPSLKKHEMITNTTKQSNFKIENQVWFHNNIPIIKMIIF